MPDQLQHIAGNIKGVIEQTAPDMIVSPSGSAAKLKVVITYFDPGTANTGFWGRGRRSDIQIAANVFIIDASGKTIGQYKVSKDISPDSLMNATTEDKDVEEGLAKSVAAIVTRKV